MNDPSKPEVGDVFRRGYCVYEVNGVDDGRLALSMLRVGKYGHLSEDEIYVDDLDEARALTPEEREAYDAMRASIERWKAIACRG